MNAVLARFPVWEIHARSLVALFVDAASLFVVQCSASFLGPRSRPHDDAGNVVWQKSGYFADQRVQPSHRQETPAMVLFLLSVDSSLPPVVHEKLANELSFLLAAVRDMRQLEVVEVGADNDAD